jgi:hypothetical protein
LRGSFIPWVGKGAQATVHFSFACNLLPGNYFVSLNASANISGRREVLTQIQDALVFKVQSNKRIANIGGLVYCHQYLETELT